MPLALAGGKAVGAVAVVLVSLRDFYQVTQGINKQQASQNMLRKRNMICMECTLKISKSCMNAKLQLK